MKDSSSPPPDAGGTQIIGVSTVLSQVADLDRRLSVVERAIVSMAGDIRDIKEILVEHSKKFEQIDKKFEQIDKKFEQIDRRLDQIDRRLDQIDRRFEQIDQRFDNLSGEVGVMHGELQKVSSLQERHGIELTKVMKRLELDSDWVGPGR